MARGPRAAVDVGSNSIRLLVVDAEGRRLTRRMAITRLATGVDASGHLDDDALERSLQTIRDYRDVWTAFGATGAVRIAATSAIRDAQDRDRFLDGVWSATGVRPEMITGEQEAELAFAGAVGGVDVPAPTAVLDIGGGSTELIVGDASGGVAGGVSLQLGCVRLTERCLRSDPVRSGERQAAAAFVDQRLDEADRVFAARRTGPREATSLIGVAGTVTTLAALHLGLTTYEESRIHASRLPARALEELTERLLSMSSARRARLGPIQPGREDVIHGGAMILNAVVQRYGFGEVVVSEADNLDGLVASLAATS